MGDSESTQINIRIDADQKRRWKEYQEESYAFASLTELIRVAVENVVPDEDEEDDARGIGDSGDESDRDATASGEVLNQLNTIERKLDGMDAELSALSTEREAEAEQESLVYKIQEQLPPHKPQTERWSRAMKGDIPRPNDPEQSAVSGRPVDVAARVDGTLRDVIGKLEEMADDGVIHTDRVDGERRYYLSE